MKSIFSKADKAFKILSKLDKVNFNKLRANNFKDFIAENELADKSLVKFLEDANITEKTLESYQEYLIKTGKSISTFTDFTKKAGTALKSLGAAMASMAVNWLKKNFVYRKRAISLFDYSFCVYKILCTNNKIFERS